MKPNQWMLRIASILMFLHAAGHSLAAITWKQAPTPQVAKVIDGMIANTFAFGGKTVSMGLFFEGYGFSMLVVLVFLCVLLWMLAMYAGEKLMRQIGILTGICLTGLAILESVYFFPVPAVLSGIAAILTFLGSRKIISSHP